MNLLTQASRIPDGLVAIKNWLGEDAQTVDQETAERRAAMCLKCPLHTDGSKIVETVAEAVRRHIEVKNKLNLRVKGEKSLHFCGVCTCSLRLKIWQPISLVKRQMLPGEFDAVENPCWQRDEKP